MKYLGLVGIIFSGLILTTTAGGAGLQLMENGRSNYVIVVDKTASDAEKTAADELQSYLEKIGGVKLPLQNQAPDAGKPAIYVGRGNAVAAQLPDIDWNKLRPDEIIIRTTSAGNLILTGARPRGSLYAVDTLLEETLGVCWWTPAAEIVPRRNPLIIPELHLRYTPPFAVREAFYAAIIKNPQFAVHMKNNGAYEKIPDSYGGKQQIIGNQHTFDVLIPYKKYFTKHPEWFSFWNHRRGGGGIPGQLCLTNEEMKKELVESAIALLQKNPGQNIISISQNDNTFYCTCPQCQAKLKELGGNQTDLLIYFLNDVAEQLAKQYPAIVVDTLAYQYTKAAPLKVRPSARIRPRLCFAEADFAKALDSNANQAAAQDVRAWSRVSSQLGIWHYTTNFRNYPLPHPNFPAVAADLRFLAANKVVSVFLQGDVGSGEAGDMTALRVWLFSHLLWNPQADYRQLTTRFLHGYYGPAATSVQKYLDLIRQAALEHPGIKLSLYMQDTASWLSYDQLLAARRLIDAAEAAVANDPVLQKRVEPIKAGLDWTLLWRYESSPWYKITTTKPHIDSEELKKIYHDAVPKLSHEAKSHGLGCLRENQKSAQVAELLDCHLQFDPPTLGNNCPEFIRNAAVADRIIIMPAQYTVYHLNSLVFAVNDPCAGGEKVWQLKGNNTQWSIQLPLPSIRTPSSTWNVYGELRAENTMPASGNAIQCGVYDELQKHDYPIFVPADKVIGTKYVFVSLGKLRFSPTAFFYIAPVSNPAIRNIYVNRLVMIRQPQQQSASLVPKGSEARGGLVKE